MKAHYLYTKYNHPKPYPIRFAYLIKGDEIELLEFEMQKKDDTIKDAQGNLVYLFTHYLGNIVDIKLNKNTNTHYMDCKELFCSQIIHEKTKMDSFWILQYQQTGDRNWLLNKKILEARNIGSKVNELEIPPKLLKELLEINYC